MADNVYTLLEKNHGNPDCAVRGLLSADAYRLAAQPKALTGWHPLNPYYKLSPYHFGKR